MKKIAVWKVVLLTLITGGIYAIFWCARIRDYLEKNEKHTEKVPRWLWLVSIPVFSGVALSVAVVALILGYSGTLSVDASLTTFGVACVLIGVYALALGLWWLWYFAKVMATITQGRMRRPAALILYVFIGAFVVAFYQYYINRLDSNKKGHVYSESAGLWVLIAVCACLGMVSITTSVISTVAMLGETRTTIEHAQVNYNEMTRLDKDYSACIDALNQKYPDEYIDPTDERAYDEAFTHCETIYSEYEAVYNKYINAL
jgi:hypothetical protein